MAASVCRTVHRGTDLLTRAPAPDTNTPTAPHEIRAGPPA
ncbi:hypothetical protein Pd630_LPD03322 [Rhodococcus opacus PD630]|nr:hypothetical protein Pd630_LPD03322 [Rhodococcus opacus PD630]